MRDDTQQTMNDLAARLWVLPIEDFLVSEEFSRFLREHDLHDAWREYLRFSEDKPDLYGGSVIKNAFSLFLSHIFHGRPTEFLHLFCGLLADFSRGISCDLPVDDLRPDLLLLGYPGHEIDHSLFILRVKEKIEPEPSGDCCPPGKNTPHR